MKTAVIVNPAAGAGRSGSRWPELRESFLQTLGEFELRLTGCPGHASELAAELIINGCERLIAVGGDGTWHEIVAGYLSVDDTLRRNVRLGTYPAGSGCDFGRHMKLPDEPRALLRLLAGDHFRRIDVVRAQVTGDDGRPVTLHLTNMAAFGLGGEVAWTVEQTGKPFGGTASYLLATLGLLLTSKARDFELIVDGIPLAETSFHSVILANTSTTGGGMKVAPDADTEDGLFEIVTFGKMSRWDMMRKFPLLYNGGHIGQAGIGLLQAKKLEARAGNGYSARLNIDGEAVGALPATFEILSGVLPVIAP